MKHALFPPLAVMALRAYDQSPHEIVPAEFVRLKKLALLTEKQFSALPKIDQDEIYIECGMAELGMPWPERRRAAWRRGKLREMARLRHDGVMTDAQFRRRPRESKAPVDRNRRLPDQR